MLKVDMARSTIKAAVSIALLACLLYLTDVHDMLSRLKVLSPAFVLFAWAYYAFCQGLSAYRWQLFLSVKDIRVPLKTLFNLYMIGMFLNNVIPGAVGGDVFKAYGLYQRTQRGDYAVTSVFLERFAGLVGLGAISIAALVFSFNRVHSPMVLAAVWGAALFLVAVITVIWSSTVFRVMGGLVDRVLPKAAGEKVKALYEAMHSYKKHKQVLLAAFGISVVIQTLFAVYYSLTAQALGIGISVYYFLLFLPIVALVSMLPISIGGLGVREAAMVALFSQVGVASADVLSISLTVFVVNGVLSLWGAAMLLAARPSAGLRKKVDQAKDKRA